MYDILGKFKNLNPQFKPLDQTEQAKEPVYQEVEPRGSITQAVNKLQESFAEFKEAALPKYNYPDVNQQRQAQAVNDNGAPEDLTKSADPELAQLAQQARFSKPKAKSDIEAIAGVAATLKKELERAKAAEEEDRQLLIKNQEVHDQMNDRFKVLNDKVATGKVTAQDIELAKAAQEIEKDADVAKAAIVAKPTAPVKQIKQPTVKPSAAKAPTTQIPQVTPTTTPEPAPAPVQNKSTIVDPNTGKPFDSPKLNIAQPQANDDDYNVSAFAKPTKKMAEGFWKNKDIENQEQLGLTNIPSSPVLTTAKDYVNYNNQKLQAMLDDSNLKNVSLVYPGTGTNYSTINLTRPMYEKLKLALASIKDPALHRSIAIDVLSNRETASRYLTSAQGDKELYYFYNVGPNDAGKAYNLGLKANPKGRWYTVGQENPNATKIWGKPQTLWVSPLRGKLAGTQQESLGNDTMKDINTLTKTLEEAYQNFKEAAKPDFLDLDKDGDTSEPMKQAAKDAKNHEPAKIDKDAVAKRKRLQALKDKQEDERAEKGDDDKSASRVVKGRAYGGSAQKDDEDKDELDEDLSKHSTAKLKSAVGKDKSADTKSGVPANYTTAQIKAELKKREEIAEVAPPGAKAERMVKHIKKGYAKDGKLSKREKGIAYATAWKAHNKGQVEEATNFGDTIKNSEGKMTKVKVTEGIGAIRQHHIYTDKDAWNHYKKELDEQETFDGVRNVQRELDEIAKLAGVPIACPVCSTAPCKCEESIMDAELPSVNVETPLSHELSNANCVVCNESPCSCTEQKIEEAVSRKDFRQAADTIKDIEDLEKRKEHAHHYADFFKERNPRFKREMFLAACGLEECDWNMNPSLEPVMGEGEMEEGNEFSGALAKAKAAGAKDFEVGGKKYTVKEDINVNITANGEEDAVNLIRKLSGMATKEVPQVTGIAIPLEDETCPTCGSTDCGCEETVDEDGPNIKNAEPRENEVLNTPREEYAAADITTKTGTGLNRSKKQYRGEYPGDNPIDAYGRNGTQVKEELWQQYEDMLSEITK